MASVVREIASDVIANHLQDPRICPMTSITRVEVSGDLQHARIHVSVMGSESDQRRTLAGLNHARAHVQRAVAAGISARQCPHISFELDQSLKKAAAILKIIEENAANRADVPTINNNVDEGACADGAGHATEDNGP
jgi:ribosome-binding factor A